MASYTAYGAWCKTDDYRAKIVVTTSVTATQVTAYVTTYVSTVGGYGYSGFETTGTAKVGTNAQASGTINYFGNGVDTKIVQSATATYRRTSAKQSVTCTGVVDAYGGKSTATYTLTIEALDSSTVAYDANGGTGAPASQTKWYGQALTLSATVPTRQYYEFLGWSADRGAVAATHAAGGPYTADAAKDTTVTLYAVWRLALVAPSIGQVTIYRVSAADTSQRDEEGTAVFLGVAWEVDASTNGNGTGGHELAIQWRAKGAGEWASAKARALTGQARPDGSKVNGVSEGVVMATGGGTLELDPAHTYEVLLTLTDSKGATATQAVWLTMPVFVIHATAAMRGRSIGIGQPASQTEEGLFVGDLPPRLADPAAWRAALGMPDVADTPWAYLLGDASATSWCRWRCLMGVVYVELNASGLASVAAKATRELGAVPEGYRPSRTVTAAAFLGSANDHTADMWVDAEGHVRANACAAWTAMYGSLSYPL